MKKMNVMIVHLINSACSLLDFSFGVYLDQRVSVYPNSTEFSLKVIKLSSCKRLAVY